MWIQLHADATSRILGRNSRLGIILVMAWVALASAGGCRKSDPRSTTSPPDTDPKRPAARRIVSMAPNSAELLCAIGACDRLVGVSSYCTFPPELTTLPKIGGLTDPDVETLLTLKPDLVILRGQGGSVRRLCENQDIAIYDDQVETLGDIYRTTQDLGRLVGHPRQAEALIERIRAGLASVADSVAGREPVTVLPVIIRDRSGLTNLMSCGKNTFLTELIEIAGGRNIFGDMSTDYPNISLEEVIGRQPEVIIEFLPGDALDEQESAELIGHWDAFDSIPAVRSGRIHIVHEPFVTVPSDRVVQSAALLRDLIHPGGASRGR